MGVGGSSSEAADVVDEPLLERDDEGLLELDDASGAKTLPMAGWLCVRSAVDRHELTHVATEHKVLGLGQAPTGGDRVDDPARSTKTSGSGCRATECGRSWSSS